MVGPCTEFGPQFDYISVDIKVKWSNMTKKKKPLAISAWAKNISQVYACIGV